MKQCATQNHISQLHEHLVLYNKIHKHRQQDAEAREGTEFKLQQICNCIISALNRLSLK